MTHLQGSVPPGRDPAESTQIPVPIAVDPDADPYVQRHVAAGWTRGDVWTYPDRPGFQAVHVYPPDDAPDERDSP